MLFGMAEITFEEASSLLMFSLVELFPSADPHASPSCMFKVSESMFLCRSLLAVSIITVAYSSRILEIIVVGFHVFPIKTIALNIIYEDNLVNQLC